MNWLSVTCALLALCVLSLTYLVHRLFLQLYRLGDRVRVLEGVARPRRAAEFSLEQWLATGEVVRNLSARSNRLKDWADMDLAVAPSSLRPNFIVAWLDKHWGRRPR